MEYLIEMEDFNRFCFTKFHFFILSYTKVELNFFDKKKLKGIYKEINERGSWKEDFEIHLEEKGLYLLIHNGTKNQKEELLEMVKNYFKFNQFKFDTEEV